MTIANIIDRFVNVSQTTNSTQATGLIWTPPGSSVSNIEAIITAVKPSDGTSASWRITALYKTVSGTVSLVGSVLDLMTAQKDTAAITWATTIDISGSNVRVRVTGGLTDTIQWMIELRTQVYIYA